MPFYGKPQNGNAKREQVGIFYKIFNVPEEDLLSLWLADQIYAVVKDEKLANKVMQIAEKKINFKQPKK